MTGRSNSIGLEGLKPLFFWHVHLAAEQAAERNLWRGIPSEARYFSSVQILKRIFTCGGGFGMTIFEFFRKLLNRDVHKPEKQWL
jgi:hypothetical protein